MVRRGRRGAARLECEIGGGAAGGFRTRARLADAGAFAGYRLAATPKKGGGGGGGGGGASASLSQRLAGAPSGTSSGDALLASLIADDNDDGGANARWALVRGVGEVLLVHRGLHVALARIELLILGCRRPQVRRRKCAGEGLLTIGNSCFV